ncbi:MAG: hypothetical protein PHS07_00040 [Patescibacteria group bacterium]|nr:hypothetical protein [Patescibacteria group bacterium]
MSKKTIFIFGLVLVFFLMGFNVRAINVVDFTNHDAPSSTFYNREFDKLVLDVTIPNQKTDGTEDVLNAITFMNNGTARDMYEIAKVVVWSDAGDVGFQGLGIDNELGETRWDGLTSSWYLSDLNQNIPAEGLRIFVSIETGSSPTNNRGVQFKIPQMEDINQNGEFDLGDQGVYVASKNNGPIDGAIINSGIQSFRNATYDALNPKVVVTNATDGMEITDNSFTIQGLCRDQGGSTCSWVKISVESENGAVVWQEVTSTGSNYETWEYNWTNILDGQYDIKVKASDWNNNQVENSEITIIKSTLQPEEPVQEPEEEIDEPEEEAEDQDEPEEEAEEEISEFTQQDTVDFDVELDSTLTQRLKGRILLQVESKGEAYYIHPDQLKRFYLGRPADAFAIMRELGLGAKHEFITSYTYYPDYVLGNILIDVDDEGRAYYINPVDKKAYYLGRPSDAFDVMRELGLGITDENLAKIEFGTL